MMLKWKEMKVKCMLRGKGRKERKKQEVHPQVSYRRKRQKRKTELVKKGVNNAKVEDNENEMHGKKETWRNKHKNNNREETRCKEIKKRTRKQ